MLSTAGTFYLAIPWCLSPVCILTQLHLEVMQRCESKFAQISYLSVVVWYLPMKADIKVELSRYIFGKFFRIKTISFLQLEKHRPIK